MRILVTGAGGFVGRVLANCLHTKGGHEVIGICRSLASARLTGGVTWLQADLAQDILPAMDIDYIVHCAALQEIGSLSVKDFVEANLAMTENIACFGKRIGIKGLIFTSSISLHGEIRGGLVDENTDIVNPSPYGIAKHLCELLLREYGTEFPTVALRLCGVVGPGAVAGWIAMMRLRAISCAPLAIYNPDQKFNNIVHIDDLYSLINSLCLRGFAGFNAFPLASRGHVTIREVAAELIDCTQAKIVEMGTSPGSFMISNEMAMGHFQYRPGDVVTNLRKFVHETK